MGHSGHSIQTYGTLRGTLLGYFKGCYRHVTALSQGCHKSGIALSQGHNNHVVTTMSQFCHRGQGNKYCVAGLLQSVSQNYYNSVTGLLQQWHKTVTAVSEDCYSSITRLLQQCHRTVTAVSQDCYSSVTGLLQQCHKTHFKNH